MKATIPNVFTDLQNFVFKRKNRMHSNFCLTVFNQIFVLDGSREMFGDDLLTQ